MTIYKAFYRAVYSAVLPVVFLSISIAQPVPRNIKTPEYKALQQQLATGWNTWYNNSVVSFVLLPQSFSINLCLTSVGGSDYLREVYKTSKAQNRPEEVVLGLRADDGSYTSLNLSYHDTKLYVQSATDGDDELILVTPIKSSVEQLVVEAGLLWNRPGQIGATDNSLTGTFTNKNIEVHTTTALVKNAYAVTSAPHITVELKEEIGIYTGKTRTLAQIKQVIAQARKVQEERKVKFGEQAEAFTAMQTILAWNTVYDAPNDRVVVPVSRNWNAGWGGFVLFDWDTYFASYMCGMLNKKLAYANAVEITKAITYNGFIPNYQAPFKKSSWDRSQPPIGSTIILELYKKYQDKWLLQEVYDELLTWNRWWPKHRDIKGYLAWGSDAVPDSMPTISKHDLQAAEYESGLDNSPMYDNVPFNNTANLMELADVGLMSEYVMDCNSLAEISAVLGKTAEAKELKLRAEKYGKALAGLWDEKAGIFLNKRTDTNEKSYRLSPTNFYPMLAKVATQKQAERMVKEHYFNPKEFYGEFVMPSIARNDSAFKDNSYWRGRIWAPMNFLVYMGMRNYNLPEARADLIKKSQALLSKSWKENGAIYENYNGTTGQGDDVDNADAFYHWGALLSFMGFVENGYMNAVK